MIWSIEPLDFLFPGFQVLLFFILLFCMNTSSLIDSWERVHQSKYFEPLHVVKCFFLKNMDMLTRYRILLKVLFPCLLTFPITIEKNNRCHSHCWFYCTKLLLSPWMLARSSLFTLLFLNFMLICPGLGIFSLFCWALFNFFNLKMYVLQS